jgi:zinc/manganese transport system substrate-binding protein
MRFWTGALPALLAGLAALVLGGCGSLPAAATGRGARVVAAENFWGSIARQIGGSHADVRSIIVNPAQDPHSYEPTAADARTMATAQVAVVNGVGYDPWASRLLAANPAPGRAVVNVGRLLGLHAGDNPHVWYDPANVLSVAGAVTRALQRVDPGQAAYYSQREHYFETDALARSNRLVTTIRRRYAGVPMGASESIFSPLASALQLRLLTPTGLLRAVSEGTEITAQDTATAERQITSRAIKVWVYNAQNATPEIQRLNGLARAQAIPIVTVTETLSPARDSFEQWQVGQLERLAAALHRATGR